MLERRNPEPDSWFATMLAWSVPASVALTAFFSWIILINSLRVPFYLYYERTIFLIYTSRSLDPLIWIASSGLTLILVAAESQARSRWSWPSVLLLWLGTAAGALGTIGVMSQQFAAVGALATLAGCFLAGNAATRSTTPSRARFVRCFLS